MSSKYYKNGKVRVVSGESYIELVEFTPEGPKIESIFLMVAQIMKILNIFLIKWNYMLNLKQKK